MRRTTFLFAVIFALLMPSTGNAGWFQHAAPAQQFKTRVYSGVTLEMSTVNGVAFATQISGSIPFDKFRNRKITISDGSKTIEAFIGSVGTGETYGSELLSYTSFETLDGWASGNGSLAVVSGGQSGQCLQLTKVSGTYQDLSSYISPSVTATGRLLLSSVYVKSGTSGNENGSILVRNYNPTTVLASLNFVSSSTWTKNSLYSTAISSQSYLEMRKNTETAGTMLFDTASVRQVLTPDASGITVTSTRGGSVQNWTSNGGINPNAASFTITISG